jgi:hypothetical protein
MSLDSDVRKLKERHSPSTGKRVREQEISDEDVRIIEELDLHSTDEAVRQYEEMMEEWQKSHQQSSIIELSQRDSISTDEHAREIRNQMVLSIQLQV